MVDFQVWVNSRYPGKKPEEIIFIHSSEKDLENINLERFENLEKIELEDNNLSSLEFLSKIPNPKKLRHLDISSNNFPPQNLDFLRDFVNLEQLYLGTSSVFHLENLKKGKRNRFSPIIPTFFKNFNQLDIINIDNTDIEGGLENLPCSISVPRYKKIHGHEVPRVSILNNDFVIFPTFDLWKKEWNIKESKPDGKNFKNYICLTLSDQSSIRKELFGNGFTYINFNEKFPGKFANFDRILLEKGKMLFSDKIREILKIGKTFWIKESFLKKFDNTLLHSIKEEDFSNGNIYYEGEIFDKLGREEDQYKPPKPTDPKPREDIPRNLDQERIETRDKSKDDIQKTFNDEKIKPSDLDSKLWNNETSWEKYLESLLDVQTITQFAKEMKQAIKSFKASQKKKHSFSKK